MKSFKRQTSNLQKLYKATIATVVIWSLLINVVFSNTALADAKTYSHLRALALNERQASADKKIPFKELDSYFRGLQEQLYELHQAQRNWHRTLKLIAAALQTSETNAVKILTKRGDLYGHRPRHAKQRRALLDRLKSGEFKARGFNHQALLRIIAQADREIDYLPLVKDMPIQSGVDANGRLTQLVSIEALATYLDAVQLEINTLREAEAVWHRTLKLIAASLESKRRRAVKILSKQGPMKERKLNEAYVGRREFTDRDFDYETLVELAIAANRLDDYLPSIDALAGLLPASGTATVRVARVAEPLGDQLDIEFQLLLEAI